MFFTIYGQGGYLGHVTWPIYLNFGSPFPKMLHIKFGFDWPSGFREEDLCMCLKMVDYRRTPARCVNGSVELKICIKM